MIAVLNDLVTTAWFVDMALVEGDNFTVALVTEGEWDDHTLHTGVGGFDVDAEGEMLALS